MIWTGIQPRRGAFPLGRREEMCMRSGSDVSDQEGNHRSTVAQSLYFRGVKSIVCWNGTVVSCGKRCLDLWCCTK